MSVVVWDGVTLAADKQGTCVGFGYRVSKIRQLSDGTIIAWTGNESAGAALAHWYENGADPANWPACQSSKDDWSRLIVVRPDGSVVTYEQYCAPIPVEAVPMAWGAGRDYALGALAMGADAKRAVEITNQLSLDCGKGVDAFSIAIDFRCLAVAK